MVIASCKSSKSSCDAYGIRWENPRIDSLGVNKDDITYIPFIPVNGAREFHINTPERGKYQVILKDEDVVVEERSFVIK
jgi:hypothetical protein